MRKLSGKTINSLALCVALAAPLVYLFGTLFMTLAGSHGEILLGDNQDAYITQNYPNTTFQIGKRDSDYFNQPVTNAYHAIMYFECDKPFVCNFIFDSTDKQGDLYMAYYNENNQKISRLTHSFAAPSFESLTGYTKYSFGYYSADPSVTASYIQPSLEIVITNSPIKPKDYNEYLFGQFFSNENFLAESGREVLDGTPLYGFEPIGELVRYTDENMLHLGNLSYGPLVIGYTYYCAHVIIVDLIFYIGSFIPRLIKKTINKLEGGLD